MRAAKTLAELSPARTNLDAPLLPPIADSRKTSFVVRKAVFGLRGPYFPTSASVDW